VRRSPDPTDGRYTLALLTESGARKVDQATPGHVRAVRQLVLAPLTQPQTRQLREISQRILRAIRDDEGWQPPSSGALLD
jgi:DNA-binding MarR family transcriptional regulator